MQLIEKAKPLTAKLAEKRREARKEELKPGEL
jgi:hypothetical protein